MSANAPYISAIANYVNILHAAHMLVDFGFHPGEELLRFDKLCAPVCGIMEVGLE